LDYPGNLAPERQLTEAQAAQRKLPEIGARTGALPAAIPMPNPELRLSLVLDDFCCRSHIPARFARRSSNVEVRTSNLVLSERHAHQLQQPACLFVGLRGGH